MYEIPIFPLNTVLFPGMPLRLHIFEDRYLQMIQRVISTSHSFGVNLIKSGAEALGPLPEPHMVGCTARIISIDKLEDGHLNVTAVGDERFRIITTSTANPWLTGYVQSAPLQSHHSLPVVRSARVLQHRLAGYLSLLAESAGGDPEKGEEMGFEFDMRDMEIPEDPMMVMYLAAALLQIPPHEKQHLLEADTAADLLANIQRLYRRELALLPGLIHTSEEEARVSAWVN